MSSEALIATRKGLFGLRDGSGKWEIQWAAFEGNSVSAVLRDPRDGLIYAALHHGHFGAKLHRSSDAGRTWTELPTPAYPPQPEGEQEIDPIRQTPVKWSLDMIWCMEAGGADEPGVIWAGTVPGGLFRSADKGQTWELNRPLWDDPGRKKWFGGGVDRPGLHSLCIHRRDSRNIAAGVSCGGIWLTGDGGRTWELRGEGMYAEYMPPELKGAREIQDAHRLARCPSQPDYMWVQHHNGVFRSTDEGRTFTEIKVPPSSFGFAVVVHPKHGDTAWFVPAQKDERRIPVDRKVVVARTRDGGKTFDVLSRGLPDQWAYHMVFRHALDIDGAGQRLIMGSTTGGVWASDDQGDSWQCVAAHLPPVHCARFAAG